MKTESGLNVIRHWWGRLFSRGNAKGEMDPETLGGLQGDAEFYWDHYWQPFWSTRSAAQQKQLLAQAPAGWRDYMQLRG